MANCKYCLKVTRGNNQYICGDCRKEWRDIARKKILIQQKNRFAKKIKEYLRFLKDKSAPEIYILRS